MSTKQPNLISVTFSSLRKAIVGISAISDELMDAGLDVAKTVSVGARYGRIELTALAAESMSEYDDATREYIKLIDDTLILPPKMGESTESTIIEGEAEEVK